MKGLDYVSGKRTKKEGMAKLLLGAVVSACLLSGCSFGGDEAEYSFKEEEKVKSYLDNQDLEQVYLKETSKFFQADYYSITRESTDILYRGEVKDNRPDGIGEIYLDDENICYLGEFDKGRFEGYGEKYVDEELVYQGYFEDGEYNGKGNEFESMDLGGYEMKVVAAGGYKDGEMNGEFKIYYNDFLKYEGGTKSGEFSGKGIVYFDESEQVRYKGEFKNGKFNGKGTLYDEEGNVVYEGKWKSGDYAE